MPSKNKAEKTPIESPATPEPTIEDQSVASNESPAATEVVLNVDPGKVIFVVTEKMSNLAHEGKSYAVIDGRVALPATERWYDDLIRAGVLKLP